jgi:hypothetical protein
MLRARRSLVRVPMKSLNFLNLPNTSRSAMALGSTQRLTKMSTGTLPVGKGRPGRKANNFTAIYEPIV